MALWSHTKISFSHDRAIARRGSKAELIATVTCGTDTYLTGGPVLGGFLATYFSTVDTAERLDETGVHHCKWDGGTVAAGKLLIYVEDGTSGVSAQVADMTDLSVTPGTMKIRFTGNVLSTYSVAGGVTDGTTITNGVG